MKKWILASLKILVSTALIAYLVRQTDLSEVLNVIRAADWPMLLVAFLMFYVGYAITAARWRILLKALGQIVNYWYLVRSFMVAVFFNNFLPSTVGGDAMRMYDSWRTGISKTNAVAAVLMDRFMGLAALLLFALCGLAMGAYTSFTSSNLVLIVGIAGAGAFVALLLLMFLPGAATERLSKILGLLPGKILSALNPIVQSLRSFGSQRRVLLTALLLSIALQANVVVYHWLVAAAFGFEIPLSAFFLIVPVAIAVMMIPISINGIGVREGVFVMLLATQGVSQAEGLAYAWLVYAFLLIQGLIGGVVFAFRSEARKPADFQTKNPSVS